MPWFQNRSGKQLWYEDAGHGVPLVFLHGWCMSSAVWQAQFKGLSNSYRLIAPDLRGHGFSRTVSMSYDFEDFADDLSDLIQFLDLADVILIGWSLGAQIALQAYQDIKDRLTALVLVSATPSFIARKDYPHGLPSNEASGMRLKIERNIGRALTGFRVRMFVDGEFEDIQTADTIKALLESIDPPETDDAIYCLDSLVSSDMRHLLPEIAVPALIMNGDCDQICLPQASQYLVEHIATTRYKIFPGCGHAPFLTRAQIFNNEIIRYVGSVYARRA